MSRHTKQTSSHAHSHEDREWFIRQNAVSIVNEKDAQIERLRKRVRQLQDGKAQLRRLWRGRSAL